MSFSARIFVTLAITVLIPLSAAESQNALVLNKLTEWNNAAPVPADQLIKSELRKVAKERYSQTATCPESDFVISRVEAATADRYVINGYLNGTLRNAWFVTAQMPKCDTAPVRFMIFQQSDASLRTIRVNRGTSYAWESLIADTFPLARLGADVALKRKGLTCKIEENAVLGVTRILSEEPGLGAAQFGIRYKGSWTEIWPLDLCDHIVEVPINFTADGDGGAYNHIAADQIRVLR